MRRGAPPSKGTYCIVLHNTVLFSTASLFEWKVHNIHSVYVDTVSRYGTVPYGEKTAGMRKKGAKLLYLCEK